jgi:anthranilate synthase component 1
VAINEDTNLDEAYLTAKETLASLRKELKKPINYNSNFTLEGSIKEHFDTEEFYKQVEAGKQNIVEGDIFQIVLSKRFSAGYTGDLLNVYRALRIINPSPYMYYLEFENDFTIIGTSPEDLLKVKNRRAQLLPIAGTRRRGKTPAEDRELENDLVNDPKEQAEHTMLVDLGRNDLGRVCKYGTVSVTEMMKVQRFSHVMHMVSKVEGDLADEKDSIDALKSCFPAGTVTGAPKIRAIQLIDEYEKQERNVYAGAVGYFDFSGNLDMCIAIRTLFAKKDIVFWQAGAGIVADSLPDLEAKEIRNKSAAMINALKYAEVIDENISN